MKKTLFVAVIAWVILISWFSSQPLKESTQQTYDFLVKLNMAEERDLVLSSTEEIRELKHLVRKAAHFGLYFGLGGLISLTFYGPFQMRGRSWFVASWTFGSLWGVIDEIHQYFVPGRSMLFQDMLIDSGGVLLAVVLLTAMTAGYHRLSSWQKEKKMYARLLN